MIRWTALLRFSGIVALVFLGSIANAQQTPPHTSAEQNVAPAKSPLDTRGSDADPLIVKVVPTPKSEEEIKQEVEERNAKRRSDDELASYTGQLAKFTRDLAKYTALLVVVGLLQGAIFIGQLVLLFRQEFWSKKHERAYVFAGPGDRLQTVVELPGAYGGTIKTVTITGIALTIGNYGRTPAFIEKIEWDTCSPDKWPLTTFSQSGLYEDVLFPNKGPMISNLSYPTPKKDSHIFYGRVTYRDVFKKPHYSVWRHLMEWRTDLNPHNWVSIALEGNATEWD